MGIFEAIRKSRAKTKAEIKAAKVRAKTEVREKAKVEARQAKLLAGVEKDLLKTEQKGLKAKRKHEMKLAKKELEKQKAGKLNASSISRYMGAARLLAPVVLPLVYRGITAAREQALQAKAKRVGVTTDQLAQYAGHGAPLKARIDGIYTSTEQAGLPLGFVRDVQDRLKELSKAVDNAEYMTPDQRRRAHRSINSDLDMITGEIQQRLV